MRSFRNENKRAPAHRPFVNKRDKAIFQQRISDGRKQRQDNKRAMVEYRQNKKQQQQRWGS